MCCQSPTQILYIIQKPDMAYGFGRLCHLSGKNHSQFSQRSKYSNCLTFWGKNMSGTRKIVVLSCQSVRVYTNAKYLWKEVFYSRCWWHSYILWPSWLELKHNHLQSPFILSSLPCTIENLSERSQRRERKHLCEYMRPRKNAALQTPGLHQCYL